MNRFLVLFAAFSSGYFVPAIHAAEIAFKKTILTDKYYCDGVCSGDINRDGNPDIVAGPFWYEGPDFTAKHAFYPPVALDPAESPSNSMFSFVHDFDRDGWPDILVLGRVHKHAARWCQNPGADDVTDGRRWKSHFAFERVRGESPALVDLFGDGVPRVICHWDGRWGWIEPVAESPYRPWQFKAIGANEDWPQFYHGEGVGDINGDGRLDLIINDGWYEQPVDRTLTEWRFHRDRFSQQRGGAQIFAFDVDGDGNNDVVSAKHAHEWGLAWYEQQPVGDSARFREHTIMGSRSDEATYGIAFSQPHAMTVADINGDGLTDLVTGKRRWAHGPDGDVEPNADPLVVWFELIRDGRKVRFKPHIIDDASGVGVQVAAADVNRDGRVDVPLGFETRYLPFSPAIGKVARIARDVAGASRYVLWCRLRDSARLWLNFLASRELQR